MEGSSPPSTHRQSIQNQEYDEVYEINDDIKIESPVELPLEIQVHSPRQQPQQRGASSTITPSSSSIQQGAKTQVKLNGRTIIRGPSHKLLSNNLIDIFQYVDAYTPEEIELPMKFMFPGPLGYTPAVHIPDPMLSPVLPIKLPKREDVTPTSTNTTLTTSTGGATVEEGGNIGTTGSGMFWSFFDTVVSPRNTPRSQTSGISNSPNTATHRNSIDTGNHNIPQSARLPTSTETSMSNGGSSITVVPTAPPTLPQSTARNPRWSGANFQRALVSSAAVTPATAQPSVPSLGPIIPLLPLMSLNNTATGGCLSTTDTNTHTHPTSSNNDEIIYEDPLNYTLGDINIAMCSSVPLLNCLRVKSHPDGEDDSCQEMTLSALLDDTEWIPSRPTQYHRVQEYLRDHKLNYNCVQQARKSTKTCSWKGNREFELERVIKPDKAENLSSGAINYDGTLLATTHYDMTCKIWRLDTGAKEHVLSGHTYHLSDCGWNFPKCDKVVTASFDKRVGVWDVASGTLLHMLLGHELEVVCISVAPSNISLCCSGGMDDLAILWNIDTGEESFSLIGHEGEVIASDFSPDGNTVVTGSMDETVRLWDVHTGHCIHKLEGHTAEVNQVKFNPHGNTVISGSIDTTCRLWDTISAKSKVLHGHTHEVVDCDFSPDGWMCASASDDNTVRIWDVLTGGCVTLLSGHTQGVCRVVFCAAAGNDQNGDSGGHQFLITGSLDATTKVWNTETGDCLQTLRGHKGLVIVSYNRATERILSLSRDNTCRVWKLEKAHDTLASLAASVIGEVEHFREKALSDENQYLPKKLEEMVRKYYERMLERKKPLGKALSPPEIKGSSSH